VFLAQVVLQPLFLVLVFGRVLTDLGFTRPGYTEVLFPGIVAMTAVLTALQSTAFPLVIDFSFTPWSSVLVLAACLVVFTAVGTRLFLRRAID
jgi:ABC-2 type transport system permease protein